MLALDADKATINVDRLLRLPGTINIPNKKKRERGRQPRAASIMELSDRVFTLADFRSVDADAAPSTRSSKRQGTQARRDLKPVLLVGAALERKIGRAHV